MSFAHTGPPIIHSARQVQGTAAQLAHSDGTCFLLTEAADLLPRWLDNSRHGSVEVIARNRIWILNGQLHIIPLKTRMPPAQDLSPGKLTFDVALDVLHSSDVSTHAPLRIQEYLGREHFARYPCAAESVTHRARVCVPLRAASVLVTSPNIAAAAARAFLGRRPKDMTSAMSVSEVWPRIPRAGPASGGRYSKGLATAGAGAAAGQQGGKDADYKREATEDGDEETCTREGGETAEELITCTLLLRKRHFKALTAQPLMVPKGWRVPECSSSGTGREVSLGIAMALGLQMYARSLGVDMWAAYGVEQRQGGAPEVDHLPEWTTYIGNLQQNGYFQGNIQGSQEYRQRLAQARAAFLQSPELSARRNAPAEQLVRQLRAPVDRAALALSWKLPEDSPWCALCCMAIHCTAAVQPQSTKLNISWKS
jgi:hypothetical protein